MRTCRWLTVVIVVLLGVAVAGCGVQRERVTQMRPASLVAVAIPGQSVSSRMGSFISVFPACACEHRTALERFSLRDGRRLGVVARLPAGPGIEVSSPHALPGGPVWLTISTGPKYRSGVAGGDPAPDSCSGRVERLDPADGKSTVVLRVPSSALITDAVPSPNGRLVVMPGGGCSTSFFNEHLIVEDLKTHKRWTIGADATPCHALFDAAWSANSSQLVSRTDPRPSPRTLTSFPTEPATRRASAKPRRARALQTPRGRSQNPQSLRFAQSHLTILSSAGRGARSPGTSSRQSP
jgi:hypothetical protein